MQLNQNSHIKHPHLSLKYKKKNCAEKLNIITITKNTSCTHSHQAL